MIKRLKILIIIQALITLFVLFLTLSACFDETVGWPDAILVICLFADATMTAGSLGRLLEIQRTEKMIDRIGCELRDFEKWLDEMAATRKEAEEHIAKEKPVRTITLEARAILPFGEPKITETMKEDLAKELGRQILKYAKYTTKPGEFDRFPTARAHIRIIPFDCGGGDVEE